MNKLYIPVGLPGCGKSTWADSIDAIVVSSDAIREELFGDASIQSDPKRVFSVMQDRTLAYLAEGNNVVYDATNLTIWSRKQILDLVPDDIKIIFVEFLIPIDVCIDRQTLRERKVPKDVIINMAERRQAITADELEGREIIYIGGENNVERNNPDG